MARNYNRSYNIPQRGISRSKGARWRLFMRIVYVLLFLGALIGGLYFFIISDFFKIKNIVVSGNDYIVSASIINEFQNIILEKKLIILKNDNLNLLNLVDAKQKLMGKFPRIESLEIIKNHPDKISINIQEKEVAEILCNGSKEELGGVKTLNYKFSECFFVDKHGVAFDMAADTQGFLILKILDLRGTNIEMGKKVLDLNLMEFVKKLKSDLRGSVNSNIKFLILDHPAQREIVAMVDDWKIIFDVSGDIGKQLMVLKRVMEGEIKQQRDKLEYIDLRIEGRAYYKLNR